MSPVEPETQQNPASSTAAPGSHYPVLANGAAEGHSSAAGHANGSGNGYSAMNLDDPRTRALLEQLLLSVAQESAAVEEKPVAGFDLTTYLAAARRRWLPMTLVFLATMAAVGWRLKPSDRSYVTTATMLLPKTSDTPGAQDALAILGNSRDAPGANVDTQIAILTSAPMIERATRQLPSELWEQVKGATVKAMAPVSPDLIDVTVTASTPRGAKALANELIEAYEQRTRNMGDRLHAQNLQFVGRRRQEVLSQLLAAKLALQRYKEGTGVVELGTSLTAYTTRIQQQEQAAQEARSEAAAGVTSNTVVNDSIYTSLQQQASNARLIYQGVIHDFYPDSPEARKAEAPMLAAEKLVDRRLAALLAKVQARARAAAAELATTRRQAAALPAIEYHLSQLMSTVALLDNTYKGLSDRYTSLSLTANAQTETATNLVPATAVVEIRRTWRNALMMGSLCGLILAALLAVLLEQLDHSVHTVEDLEPLLHSSVLGNMPYLKRPVERRLAPTAGVNSAVPLLLESCRIIRSNLAFATVDAPARTVLVTSADPGEGKSLCALNLATVMAMDGRRVALLDCDLRRPAQHLLNDLPLEPGFSNVLSGEASMGEVVHPGQVANLSVIPAGTPPSNPPELLGGSHSRQLLQEMRELYDVVVIDSPPVLSLTDAQVLCSVADGVVMVVAADSTTKAHVQRAQSMLRHAGGRILGVIFNKVQERHNPDAYNAYYSYNADQGRLGQGIKGLLTGGR